MKAHCRECLVPAAEHLLFDGLCVECVPEHLDLPAEDRQWLDRMGVDACRRAGINAMDKPCKQPLLEGQGFRCGCRPVEIKGVPRETAWKRQRRRARGATFDAFDAADLERYFRTKLPPAAWDHSAFGAMCQRIGEATNPDSLERPTPLRQHHGPHGLCEEDGCHTHGAAWTEIIDVSASSHAGRFGSWEDQMAAYLDARNKQFRVWHVLARLPGWARDVLEARYGESEEASASSKQLGVMAGVALLTDTARFIRDRRAADGKVEWVEHEEFDPVTGKDKTTSSQRAPTARGVLIELARQSRSSSVSAQERSSTTEALGRIRREAEELLRKAETAYAREAAS